MLLLVNSSDEYKHLDSDAFDAIAGYTNSKELDRIKEETRTDGGEYNMCRAITELIEDGKMIGRDEGIAIGRSEGITIGRSEGEKKALVKMVCRKMAKGKIVSEIAEDLDVDATEIDKIYQAALKYAPNYDIDAILENIL